MPIFFNIILTTETLSITTIHQAATQKQLFFFHFRSERPVSLRFLGAKWNQNRAYFQVELEFGVLQVFVEGKLSQQRREPTADSTNLGFKPGAHWWRELSILCHHLLP